ncbi:hypothetical protein G6F31_016786 [Rhizopus arrhizus]|nr:hypothetical protein G6F31_016786 [Rhizopus arrhizus]
MMHHAIPMTRSGKHPLQELGTLLALVRLFRRVRPDVVHLVTIKPVLYGGIAARLARVRGMVAAISGLGFVFLSNSLKMRLVRSVVARLYRIALGHPNSRVIFQNANDRDLLKSLGAVRDDQVVMIRGAGVDLDAYRALPEPAAPPVVVTMVARLLRDHKGEHIGLLAPLVTARKGYYTDLAKWAGSKGHTHLRVDGEFIPVAPWPRLDRYKEHTIELPVADVVVDPANEADLRAACGR